MVQHMNTSFDPLPYEGREPFTNFAWPAGARAALTFSFDDARTSQALVGAPRLTERGIHGTFYAVPRAVAREPDAWQAVVDGGHEIGHHTKLHPCARDLGVSKVFLEDYSLAALEEEIAQAGEELFDLLGVTPVSFAYPCGNTFVGAGAERRSYVPLIARLFQSGRGYPHIDANDPLTCNFEYLRSTKLDGVSLESASAVVEAAVERGQWLIFTAHETPTDDVVLPALLDTVAARSDIWIDSVAAVAEHVLANR